MVRPLTTLRLNDWDSLFVADWMYSLPCYQKTITHLFTITNKALYGHLHNSIQLTLISKYFISNSQTCNWFCISLERTTKQPKGTSAEPRFVSMRPCCMRSRNEQARSFLTARMSSLGGSLMACSSSDSVVLVELNFNWFFWYAARTLP